jgi:arabinose-5-phosphate isomerase
MQLALGRRPRVALLEQRGFTAEHFRVFHPGGKLGAMLKHVRDVMHTGRRACPVVITGTLMDEALAVQSEKSFGCVIVVRPGRAARRHRHRRRPAPAPQQRPPQPPRRRGDDHRPDHDPPRHAPRRGAGDHRIAQEGRLVVAEAGRPVGLVHVLDLLRAGVA